MEKYKQLIEALESTKQDAEKFFEKGNKSAGTRLRKGMQDVKTLAQEVRVSVTEEKKKVQE